LQEKEMPPDKPGVLCEIPDPEASLVEEMYHPVELKSAMCGGSVGAEHLTPTQPERRELSNILKFLPTHKLDPYQKHLVFKCRYSLRKDPKALCVFLRCVDWAEEDAAEEGVALMREWAPVGISEALELLSARFQV
jgi:hypothetical protein